LAGRGAAQRNHHIELSADAGSYQLKYIRKNLLEYWWARCRWPKDISVACHGCAPVQKESSIPKGTHRQTRNFGHNYYCCGECPDLVTNPSSTTKGNSTIRRVNRMSRVDTSPPAATTKLASNGAAQFALDVSSVRSRIQICRRPGNHGFRINLFESRVYFAREHADAMHGIVVL